MQNGGLQMSRKMTCKAGISCFAASSWRVIRMHLGLGAGLGPHLLVALGLKNWCVWIISTFTWKTDVVSREVRQKWCRMVVSKWPGKIYVPRSTVTCTIKKCQTWWKMTKTEIFYFHSNSASTFYGAFFVTLTLTKYAHICFFVSTFIFQSTNTIQVNTQPFPSLQSPFHHSNPSIMTDWSDGNE